MERSLTLQQPPSLGREGVADATSRLFCSLFATIFSRPGRAAAAVQALSRPNLPAEPRAQEAWHSYAVYSGALSLRHYKSSRRYP
jgi:hypothetical protein